MLEMVNGCYPCHIPWWPQPMARQCTRMAAASSLSGSLMYCKYSSAEFPGADNADRWRLSPNSVPVVKYCRFIAFPFILVSRLSAFLTHCCSASACNFYLLREHPLDKAGALQVLM